jgi:hypothetical protein
MFRPIPHALALALVLSGCNRLDHHRPPPEVPGLAKIPELFRLEESGIEQKSRRIVKSRGEWDTLWRGITGAHRYTGPQPGVDFSREMLAVATAGPGSASVPVTSFQGYRIRSDTLQIYVLLTFPTDDCGAPDDFSHPIVIGRVPRWKRVVRFYDVRTERCG